MNPDELSLAARRFVVAATGLDGDHVIPQNDPGVSPNGLYASVLLMTIEEFGTKPYKLREDPHGDDLIAHLKVPARAAMSIQFYRGGAAAAAAKLMNFCNSPNGLREARKRDFLIALSSPLRRLDMVNLTGAFEERVSLDLQIDFSFQYAQSVGKITTAPFQIEMGSHPATSEEVTI